jgi:hypothetical protein
MKRSLYALAMLPVFLYCNSCYAQGTDSSAIFKTLFKCWRSVSHEYASIYGLEEDEIKIYAKQRVCFRRDTIAMYHGALYAPHYSIKKVNAENFAKENFDCSKVKLGMLKDSVYEITISSLTRSAKNGTEHKMTDVIAFDGDFIYVVKDGVIFKLIDADIKSGGRSSN